MAKINDTSAYPVVPAASSDIIPVSDGGSGGDTKNVTAQSIADLAFPNTLTTTAPSSASDTGTAGQVAYDSDYIYVCVATDTWKRASIATW